MYIERITNVSIIWIITYTHAAKLELDLTNLYIIYYFYILYKNNEKILRKNQENKLIYHSLDLSTQLH